MSAAKKKNKNLRKQLFIVGGCLLVLQIGLLAYFKFFVSVPSPKEAIEAAVDKTPGVTSERKPILMVQLALVQYQSKNGGKLPTSLNQLVPKYISSVPKGPDGQQIAYSVNGKSYTLGDAALSAVINKSSPSDPKESTLTISDEDKEKLINSLDEVANANRPIYDPAGKRDPFQPVDLAPNESKRRQLTPLENYTLDKLSYAAFIKTEGEPKAILENNEGRGYTVSKGSKVGPNNGEITEITPEKIVVVESVVNLKGDITAKTYEFVIGVKGSSTSRR